MSKSNHDLENKTSKLVGLFFVTVLLFVCLYGAWVNMNIPVVTIKVADTSMIQDEEIPVFAVYASTDKESENLVLGSNAEYQVKDLVEDINNGKGYQLKHSINSAYEGEYPIELEISEELKEKFADSWSGQVRIKVENGILKIKNKFGEWNGKKFKRNDGTYVTEAFMVLNEGTYYFDANGEKVAGEQEILGNVYYFEENGKFDEEKNKINPAKPMIALTFDDGPGKYTERLLDALEKYDARATFFMLGSNVNKYPEAVEKMKEIGCEIGNHTTDHKNLTKLEVPEIIGQIETTNDSIKNIIGEGASIVRPPYGAVNDLVKSTVTYPLVMWSIDTLDWELKNAEALKECTLEIVKDGDIVLMHDIHETTVDAVITLIPELQARGYQLVTVSEMAQIHGINMENGIKYFRF